MKYLLLLVLAGCTAKPTQDNGFIRNVYGESIIQCYLPIEVNVNGQDSKTKASALYAMNEWNTKFGKILFTLSESSENTVATVKAWEYQNNQQAITMSRWAGNCIYSAQIIINVRDFYYYRTGERQSGINLDALVLHELGHVLGLIDNDIPASVMYRYLDTQENRINATEYDINNLRTVYR